MPWTAESFRRKHNKKLSLSQARKAVAIANDILARTGDDARAIRVANMIFKKKKKGKGGKSRR